MPKIIIDTLVTEYSLFINIKQLKYIQKRILNL